MVNPNPHATSLVDRNQGKIIPRTGRRSSSSVLKLIEPASPMTYHSPMIDENLWINIVAACHIGLTDYENQELPTKTETDEELNFSLLNSNLFSIHILRCMLRFAAVSTKPALKTLLSSCLVKYKATTNSRLQVSAVTARYLSAWVALNKHGYISNRQPAIPFNRKALKNTTTSSSLTTPTFLKCYQSFFHHTSEPQYLPSSQVNDFNERQTNHYKSDLVLVLDLDECLIHSAKDDKIYDSSAEECDSFHVELPDYANEIVHVYMRPRLIDFLKFVTTKYETHIFTAAMPEYAKPILDYLCCAVRERSTANYCDNSIFAGRWYRDHCTYDPMHDAYVKDLSKLPTINSRLNKTVLIDNNPLSFLSHPENGIWVKSFYTNGKDKTLPYMTSVLDDLEDADDVRPMLKERFQLEQYIKRKYNNSHKLL